MAAWEMLYGKRLDENASSKTAAYSSNHQKRLHMRYFLEDSCLENDSMETTA
jgi:hypothetical protein